MANEILDILMGKYLDGEITPEEQRLLDQSLATDESAREEFDRYCRLHDQIRSVVNSALEGGKPMEEIFEAAWQKSSPVRRMHRRLFRREWLLAASGLAAGLLLGIVLHALILAPGEALRSNSESVVRNSSDPSLVPPSGIDPSRIIPVDNRYVDWFTITEPSGDQLLLEGYRRQQIVPVLYYGDL